MRPTARIRRAKTAAATLGLAAGLAGGAPALAQSVVSPGAPGLAGELALPGVPGAAAAAARPDVRLGGFFDDEVLGGLLPSRRGDTARAFDWFGRLQLRGFATDNFNNAPASGNREAEFVGSIRPTLGLVADSARLTGRVLYSPNLQFFASGRQPTRLDHRFNGNMTAVVVPDAVFVNARAFGAVVPILPGTLDTESPQPRNNLAQTYGFTLSPYAIQRFGTRATGIAGYTLTHTVFSGRAVSLTPGGPAIFRPSELTAHTGYAALRTGEDFGRVAAELRGRASYFQGGGAVTDGAHRALALLETRFAFTRTIYGLVEGGYESLQYGGTRPVDINEPVWGVGLRLDPGANTTIIVRYRRRNGFESPQVEARASLGPRTVVFANYLERLGTGLSRQGDLLNAISVDELGNPVDSRTGEPVPDLGNSSVLGTTGVTSLNRTRLGSLGVTRFFARDTVTFRYLYNKRTPVSADFGTLALEQEAHTASVVYQRPLSPQTSLIGLAQVGVFETANVGNRGTSYLGRAVIRHLFNERLSGTLQYQLTYRTSETDRGGISLGPRESVQNAIIATLTQAF